MMFYIVKNAISFTAIVFKF